MPADLLIHAAFIAAYQSASDAPQLPHAVNLLSTSEATESASRYSQQVSYSDSPSYFYVYSLAYSTFLANVLDPSFTFIAGSEPTTSSS